MPTSQLYKEVEELEEKCEDLEKENSKLQDEVEKLKCELADSEEDYSTLANELESFTTYAESIQPGIWAAFKAAQVLEGKT
jgi:predicted nuclease with TOPRIM domain